MYKIYVYIYLHNVCCDLWMYYCKYKAWLLSSWSCCVILLWFELWMYNCKCEGKHLVCFLMILLHPKTIHCVHDVEQCLNPALFGGKSCALLHRRHYCSGIWQKRISYIDKENIHFLFENAFGYDVWWVYHRVNSYIIHVNWGNYYW